MNTKSHFNSIASAYSTYAAKVNEILGAYKQDLASEKIRCAQFKDEASELEKAKAKLIEEARTKIQYADATLAVAVRDNVASLRSILSDRMSKAPSPEFVTALKAFTDFDIPMSKGDVETLSAMANGNYLGLRSLQAVAAKHKLTVDVPGVDALQDDIKQLENGIRGPQYYCGNFIIEAKDVLENKPNWVPEGPLVPGNSRPDGLFLSTQLGKVDGAGKRMDEAAERWAVID